MQNLENFRTKSTSKITVEEWEFLREKGVCNGCGGKDCFISHFLASLIAPIFFEASCDKHDFGYWKGGDEARRKECDRKFLEAILKDINKQYYQGIWYYYENINIDKKLKYENIRNIPAYEYFFKKFYYKIIAYLFYFSVRIGGKKYFNFTNK